MLDELSDQQLEEVTEPVLDARERTGRCQGAAFRCHGESISVAVIRRSTRRSGTSHIRATAT